MLRTTCPNISVITNFGCRANCWYCIWKGHRLENISKPTDWAKLHKFLVDNRYKGKVSVSGGGDCLYQYRKYAHWWEVFFRITNSIGMVVDVHTREKFRNNLFWVEHINRCVFSSDRLEEDKRYLLYLSALTKVRITHLVTAETTLKMIEEYLDFQKKINCQFTIKELVGYSDNGMYKKIKSIYPEIYHLDDGDYNIYYMPDNTVSESFL